MALEECRVDLKALADRLGAPRFSFGAAELLNEVLGVRPGSVTPFAAINDAGRRVTLVLQRAMLEHDPLNYHPLENDRTTAVAPGDLVRFLEACGHPPRIVEVAERGRLSHPKRRLSSRRHVPPCCGLSQRKRDRA